MAAKLKLIPGSTIRWAARRSRPGIHSDVFVGIISTYISLATPQNDRNSITRKEKAKKCESRSKALYRSRDRPVTAVSSEFTLWNSGWPSGGLPDLLAQIGTV
jgi:hypothetical protein